MTRFDFLLRAAAIIEYHEPQRLKGFRESTALLLSHVHSQGYDLRQELNLIDIDAMIQAVDFQVTLLSDGEVYPQHAGLLRTPEDAAVHFLAVIGWLEAKHVKPALRPLLEAIIAPFIPVRLVS